MLSTARRIAERVWLAAFLVFALFFLVNYVRDNRELLSGIARADVRLLGLALLAHTLYFAATVKTWRLALYASGPLTIANREGLSQILLVNFGKYIPGKVWGLTARGVRLKELGFGLAQIARASYVEQVFLLATGLWLALASAGVAFDSALYFVLTALLTIVMAMFNLSSRMVGKALQFIPRLAAAGSLFAAHIEVRKLLKVSLGYLVVWLALASTFVLLSRSVLLWELNLHALAVFLLSVTAGYLGGFIAVFAPGGVGVREGIGAAFLSSIVTLEQAVWLMLLFRLWTVAAELLAGLVLVAAQRNALWAGEGK